MTPTTSSTFLEYSKIDTIFERSLQTFMVDESKLKQPVLATISKWEVTEKINGTNIRVMLSEEGTITFGGRTQAAQIPADLIKYLISTFPAEKLKEVLWRDGPVPVILFGEGYGPGIQKGGGLYRQDKALIMFDVLVGGRWWLERTDVNEIASKLGIEGVPFLGTWTLDEIVAKVRSPFPSKLGTAIAEGIVARPIQTLFDRRGERLIIKLKTKDFKPGKEILS